MPRAARDLIKATPSAQSVAAWVGASILSAGHIIQDSYDSDGALIERLPFEATDWGSVTGESWQIAAPLPNFNPTPLVLSLPGGKTLVSGAAAAGSGVWVIDTSGEIAAAGVVAESGATHQTQLPGSDEFLMGESHAAMTYAVYDGTRVWWATVTASDGGGGVLPTITIDVFRATPDEIIAGGSFGYISHTVDNSFYGSADAGGNFVDILGLGIAVGANEMSVAMRASHFENNAFNWTFIGWNAWSFNKATGAFIGSLPCTNTPINTPDDGVDAAGAAIPVASPTDKPIEYGTGASGNTTKAVDENTWARQDVATLAWNQSTGSRVVDVNADRDEMVYSDIETVASVDHLHARHVGNGGNTIADTTLENPAEGAHRYVLFYRE